MERFYCFARGFLITSGALALLITFTIIVTLLACLAGASSDFAAILGIVAGVGLIGGTMSVLIR
jgi:hypothetical protein